MMVFFLENSYDLLFPQKRSIIDIWHDSKCRGGPPKVLYNKQWSYKFWKIRRKKPVIESLKEETLAQVFSCEFWEICKNNFFLENLRWLLLSIHLWITEIAFTITIQMTILGSPSSGLAPHWLSCSEVYFTTIIFYYVGQTPPDVQWRKRKTKLSRT